MKITSEIETITPAKAKEMLQRNTLNRPVSENNLAYLRRQIMDGTYQLTGESIKFSETGTLLDGQHRLMAVVDTNITIKSVVTRGLKNEAFAYIDTGRVRTAGDVLGIAGYTYGTAFSSMIKFINTFKNAGGGAAAKYSPASGAGSYRKMTNKEVLDYMVKHKDSLMQSYPYGFTSKNKIFSKTFVAGLHYICKSKDGVRADEFFGRFIDGIFLEPTSPIYLLRQKFFADEKAKKKMSKKDKVALIIKAWNMFRKNKKGTVLVWNESNEGFPEIQ